MRRPGIEPGSTTWKAAMLTIIPPALAEGKAYNCALNSQYRTLFITNESLVKKRNCCANKVLWLFGLECASFFMRNPAADDDSATSLFKQN